MNFIFILTLKTKIIHSVLTKNIMMQIEFETEKNNLKVYS